MFKHMRNILIVDNYEKEPCGACYKFRRNIKSQHKVTEVYHHELPKRIDEFTHILFTGGPGSPYDWDKQFLRKQAFILEAVEKEIPIMGICLGAEDIIVALTNDRSIEQYHDPRLGWFHIHRNGPSRLLDNLPEKFHVFENHMRTIGRLPKDFIATASSSGCPIEAYEHKNLPIFGTQFHPEMTPTHAQKTINDFEKYELPERWLHDSRKTKQDFSPKTMHHIFENFYNQPSKLK